LQKVEDNRDVALGDERVDLHPLGAQSHRGVLQTAVGAPALSGELRRGLMAHLDVAGAQVDRLVLFVEQAELEVRDVQEYSLLRLCGKRRRERRAG
jgi:hypothetical protein